MNAKYRYERVMFTCAIILFVLACNIPGAQISAPPTIVPLIITATQPSLAQNVTVSETPTITPTLPDLGPVVNFGGGGTATPTSSPTPSPTPTLPDFDPIVNFGAGGGSGCGNAPARAPNDALITQKGKSVEICLYLWGLNFSKPFYISLVRIGGDGTVVLSPNLWLDQTNRVLKWEGYQRSDGFIDWTSDGTISINEVRIWWPLHFSPGQWQLSVIQANSAFTGFSINFQITGDNEAHINALDPRSEYEIMPSSIFHPIRTKDNGNVTVAGMNYSARAPVFILLYRERPSNSPIWVAEFELIQKQVVTSDANGNITTELSGPFEPGQSYLVYGITDPYIPIGDNLFGECGVGTPCDFFEVISANPTISQPASSCPGAPAQRMTVNQRGYVCTKEDAVKLRTAPKRSGSEIMQLPPGVSFAVIEGPSCADNWSWWKIRLDNGTTGWISEGGDEIDPYFICPLN